MRDGSREPVRDQAGEPWDIDNALGTGAVVLVFYRGDW